MKRKLLVVLSVALLSVAGISARVDASAHTPPNYMGTTTTPGGYQPQCPFADWTVLHEHGNQFNGGWTNNSYNVLYAYQQIGGPNEGGDNCYNWLGIDASVALYKTNTWPPTNVLCSYVGGQGFWAASRFVQWYNASIFNTCGQNPVVTSHSYTVAAGQGSYTWFSHSGGTAWVEMCTC